MKTTKWFLAHSRHDEDNDIDTWVADVAKHLSESVGKAEVVAGRDDYKSRAYSIGGWSSWCRDVYMGECYLGGPMFHGAVVPFKGESPTVGRATSDMIEGFIGREKKVYAWCVDSNALSEIVGIEPCGLDNYNVWSRLLFSDQP